MRRRWERPLRGGHHMTWWPSLFGYLRRRSLRISVFYRRARSSSISISAARLLACSCVRLQDYESTPWPIHIKYSRQKIEAENALLDAYCGAAGFPVTISCLPPTAEKPPVTPHGARGTGRSLKRNLMEKPVIIPGTALPVDRDPRVGSCQRLCGTDGQSTCHWTFLLP